MSYRCLIYSVLLFAISLSAGNIYGQQVRASRQKTLLSFRKDTFYIQAGSGHDTFFQTGNLVPYHGLDKRKNALRDNGQLHNDRFYESNRLQDMGGYIVNGAFTLSIDTVGSSCGAYNGSIVVLASGGVAPYTYTYVHTSTSYIQSTGNFRNLVAGVYDITVTDAAGQAVSTPVDLSNALQPPEVTAVTLVGPSQCNSLDGKLTVTVTGGVPPYQYSLDGINYQNSNVFTGLPQGLYTWFVRDANGCNSFYTGSIFLNSIVSCFTIGITGSNAGCVNDGFLLVGVVAGGTPPFEYSSDGVTYHAGNLFDNLAPGLHPLYFRDATGAVNIFSSLIVAECPDVTATPTDATCGKDDGSMKVTAIFGNGPYTYSIDGVNFQTSNIFTGLGSGDYTVTVKDVNGLLSSGYAFVYEKCPLGNANATDETCGQGDGTITAYGYNGTQPYRYSLDGINFQNNNFFTGLSAGDYTITIKDANDYMGTTSVTVKGSCLQLDLDVTNTFCGKDSGSIAITVSRGIAPYMYSINGGVYVNGNVFSGLTAGSYQVAVMDSGNEIKDTVVTISDTPGPQVTTSFTPASCDNHDGSIQIFGAGGTPPYQYSIDNSNFSIGDIFTSLDSGKYIAYIKDANGCIASDAIQLAGQQCACKLYVPSAFTPNHDGLNDVFKPQYQCFLSDYEMKIFNRPGQLVFVTGNPAEGWNGTFKNSPQPAGVYVYELKYKDSLTGKAERKKGTVTLLR